MFGKIKENILSSLEKNYTENGDNVFKKRFNQYVKTVKGNPSLTECYKIYDSFTQVKFNDKDVAKEFVEESISKLKSVDKAEINKLLSLIEEKIQKISENSVEHKLDELAFNDKISLAKKSQYKVDLINEVTKKENSPVSHQETFNKLHQNINENISKLDDEQKSILELFVENDNTKVTEFYNDLIATTEDIVENKILNSDNHDITKRLVEVKRKLKELKNNTPNIDDVESILNLKKSLI